jgi:hypothetical protein
MSGSGRAPNLLYGSGSDIVRYFHSNLLIERDFLSGPNVPSTAQIRRDAAFGSDVNNTTQRECSSNALSKFESINPNREVHARGWQRSGQGWRAYIMADVKADAFGESLKNHINT